MTADERRARADHICQRLVTRICAEAPPGLGLKEETWWAVERQSERFMEALTAFEDGVGEELPGGLGATIAEQAVIDAGVKLRAAWQRAADL